MIENYCPPTNSNRQTKLQHCLSKTTPCEVDGITTIPLQDWTREDTLAMPSKLLSDIFDFINWERNGWPEEGKDS